MSKERTQKEIDAEIKALEGCRKYIPRETAFGDDNFAKLDLAIDFLKGEIDIDETAEEWNERSDDEQSVLLEAQSWRDGETDESPSSGWDNFKPKKK